MRYTHYYWRHSETKKIDRCAFSDIPFSGYSELEALRLINRWNQSNPEHWQYWL